jgi:hypothetical protein
VKECARPDERDVPPGPCPSVTIVVPVYNGEPFLRQSLDSIVAQDYPNLEVLVMDDASTDATADIVASCGDRVIYHRQPRNRGQFENVSDGVALARGEYVAVYHADDIYLPTIVSREAAFLAGHPQAGAVFALDVMIDAQGRERGSGKVRLPDEIREGGLLDYETILNVILLYKNRIFRAPSSMVRASTYREMGRYRGREFPVAADFEMFFRIARHYPVGILNEHLFRYRWGHGNADQLDRLGRLGPEPYFAIIEEHLDAGGRALAHPASLTAHAAHFAEDQLMRAVNHYILGKLDDGLALLNSMSVGDLLGSEKVQRGRLLALWMLLHVLMRAPRSPAIAASFYRRWYANLAKTHGRRLEDLLPLMAQRGYY